MRITNNQILCLSVILSLANCTHTIFVEKQSVKEAPKEIVKEEVKNDDVKEKEDITLTPQQKAILTDCFDSCAILDELKCSEATDMQVCIRQCILGTITKTYSVECITAATSVLEVRRCPHIECGCVSCLTI